MMNTGFNQHSHTQQQQQLQQDPTASLDDFLNSIIESLDQKYISTQSIDYYKTSIIPQLLSQSRIIINGTPFGSKLDFQQIWSSLPITQHQLSSFDAHLIPSSNGQPRQFIILAHLKVRFDESGKNRLGESANLVALPSSGKPTGPNANRPLFSNWFGVTINIVADEKIIQDYKSESISSFDYRITEKPDSSLFMI